MTFSSSLDAGLQPIEPIEGSPDEIRRIGQGLRDLTGRLDAPRRAAESVQQVRHKAVWEGAGFNAFLELITMLPKPSDVDNAVDRITYLASRVETFAEILHECQVEHERRRDEFDAALPAPEAEVDDELVATLSGVRLRAADVLDRLEEASATLRNAFDEIDQETIYAEPPPSGWERAANALDDLGRLTKEFVIGVGEGAWTMVTGLVKLMIYLNPIVMPFTAYKLWQNRETIKGIATFAWEHPDQFAKEMGKAVVDYETFKASPARWAGKLVPDIVLTIVTAGSGGVATKASNTTVQLIRGADKVVDLGEDVTRASRVVNRMKLLKADALGVRGVSDMRLTLHEGVGLVEDAVDPMILRNDRLLSTSKALKTAGQAQLGPGELIWKYGTMPVRGKVKNMLTGGVYSKAKLADHVVNGFPRMSRTEIGLYVGSRAMNRGDSLTNLDDYESYFDTAIDNFEAKQQKEAQGQGTMRLPAWAPEKQPEPAARYQTTSSPP